MKPKLGRPPLPEGASKGARLIIRIMESEEAEIDAAAKRAGKTKSQWVRDTLLDTARGKAQRRAGRKGTGSLPSAVKLDRSERAERQEPSHPEQPFMSDISANLEFLD